MVLVWLVCACTELAVEPIANTRVVTKDFALVVPRQLDLLFVIDASPAMTPHHLGERSAGMINTLSAMQGGLPSLHVGVITADPGGELRQLRDEALADGSRRRDYVGTLPQAFTKLAQVGSGGGVYPRPLEAMQRALSSDASGFVRERATLEVVFITAQDDCSFEVPFPAPSSRAIGALRCVTHAAELAPVSGYAAFLHGVKRDPSRVAVAVIAGPPGPSRIEQHRVVPSCSVDGASAWPANRLAAMRSEFPNRSAAASICGASFDEALGLFGGFGTPASDPCWPVALADVDDEAAGRQVDCAVAYRFADGDEQVIPACAGDARPCWQIEPDEQCSTGPREALRVLGAATELPAGTHVVASCVAA